MVEVNKAQQLACTALAQPWTRRCSRWLRDSSSVQQCPTGTLVTLKRAIGKTVCVRPDGDGDEVARTYLCITAR